MKLLKIVKRLLAKIIQIWNDKTPSIVMKVFFNYFKFEVNSVEKVISIINDRGIPFNVRLVEKGDNYGLNFALTHNEDDPLVEFYDDRYKHTKYGQFVSRYYLSTLLERDKDYGLYLYADVPDWQVSAENMNDVLEFVEQKHLGESFSIDVFDKEELKKVAFLYSDYVNESTSEFARTLDSELPYSIQDFVQNDLNHYVGRSLLSGEKDPTLLSIKGKMEGYGYDFSEYDLNKIKRSISKYTELER